MQITDRTRTIALGTAAGVAIALSGTALAVAVTGADDHGDGGRPAFAAQQDGGRGAMGQAPQQGYGGPQGQGGPQSQGGPQDQGSQQGYGDQQSAGPPMQSGTS